METRCFLGFKIKQRENENTVSFFAFYAYASDVVKWVGIRRIEDSPEGTQRILRKSRVKAITRFLESNQINTIPNNILVAFEPEKVSFASLGSGQDFNVSIDSTDAINNWPLARVDLDLIKFTFNPKINSEYPAYIVDGQHRLFGIANFNQEDIPILVICLIDAPLEEQAFQFIVINNKSVRVQTDNAKSIIASLDEDSLTERLLRAGVRYGNTSPILREINDLLTSPFNKLLDWPYNRDGNRLIPLTAIEQSLRYLKGIFPFAEDDEDSLLEIFCAIWRGIRNSFPELWGQDNTFMKKVNVNALNEFVSDRIKTYWIDGSIDIFSLENVESKVLDIVKVIPKEFWEQEWSVVIQDNANVRKMIIRDLERILLNSRMKRAWREELELPISPSIGEVGDY